MVLILETDNNTSLDAGGNLDMDKLGESLREIFEALEKVRRRLDKIKKDKVAATHEEVKTYRYDNPEDVLLLLQNQDFQKTSWGYHTRPTKSKVNFISSVIK